MAKNLVIVESPAKSKTINKYLGNDYEVIASFGHVRDLPSKNGSVLPDDDFKMIYEVSSGSTKHVKTIKDRAKGKENIILATDPDREGEAISWHVAEILKQARGLKGLNFQRVSFNEITKTAILKAFANPRDLDMDLINAQRARLALDYLVGFTLSPILWRKLPGSRSAGRVQSVALRLISDRESEIEEFNPQEYWDIKIDFENEKKKKFTANLQEVAGEKLKKFSLKDEKSAANIVKNLEGKDYAVSGINRKTVKRTPKPPFMTSTLQMDASRRLGFGAKRTMQVAQKLYEGVTIEGETVGLITYMRTDGITVSNEAINSARNQIEKDFGKEYLPEKPIFYKSKAKAAQEAHEAIRPTHMEYTPAFAKKYLDDDLFRLYELIWKRMISSQMANAIFDQVSVDIASKDKYAMLRATGQTMKFAGFLKLYREAIDGADEKDENILPPLNEGEDLNPLNILPAQHFTQPPPRYSEATLVKTLEELGIGRPSTYASIISVLQDRNYVRIENKRFIPESRGRIVTEFLLNFFKKYVEFDFTASLEEELDQIASGKIIWKDFLKKFWVGFNENVGEVSERTITEVIEVLDKSLESHIFPVTEENPNPRNCPSCKDGKLSLKLGKFGGFIGCSNYPECKHVRQLSDNPDIDGAGLEESIDKVLGKKDGKDVWLKKGPYGFYVQLGELEGKVKPKRMSIPKKVDPATVDLNYAENLLALPREIGVHPEDDKKIKTSIGPYGPYVVHNGIYASLSSVEDVFELDVEKAVILLEESKKKKSGKKSAREPLRTLGQHKKKDVVILPGVRGRSAYIKYEKTNIPMPKGKTVEDITLEEVVELIKKK